MDYSWHGLRYARQMGLERAVQGDIMRLPFADGAFDLVMSVDVLAHLPRGEEQSPRVSWRGCWRRAVSWLSVPRRSTSCAAAIPNSPSSGSGSHGAG